jgi:uroporphyrinogen decarboxylase
MLESCLTPAMVVEITLQPVRRHKVDAAIFFSDIVIPLKLAGVGVEIQAGIGPVIAAPVRTRSDFEALGQIPHLALEPIRLACSQLAEDLGNTPLIGFGGAPFTVASYLVEGGPSKDLPASRAMMKEDPKLWADVLDWCARVTADFIRAQVLEGASALQVFDSWAGKLSVEEYEQFAAPHTKRLFSLLEDLVYGGSIPVPRIHFGVGTKNILSQMLATGATVMGVDSETELSEASKILGGSIPLQGNIPTALLYGSFEELAEQTRKVLQSGKSAPGHVVNLGHGVPKDTDPDVLTKLVELIHKESS